MSLRRKSVFFTIFFIAQYIVLQVVDLTTLISVDEKIVKALFSSIIFLLGLYWVLGFKIKGIRFITILGYSAFIVFVQSLFLELIVFQDLGRISEKTLSLLILFVFGLSVYFLILTVNILNVSYISKIPLAQAAKAANFIYTLFSAYFSFLLLSRADTLIWYKLIAFTVVIFLLTLNIYWFKKESARQLFGETFSVVLMMITIFLIFIIWPLSVEVSTMFYTIVFYILLGLGLEQRETTSFVMRVEYFVLFVFALLILLKLTSWGINGPMI